MRKPISRIISVLLALVLIAGMVPAMPRPVQAATTDQLNMAARADYMYDSTWVCQQTTTCCAYGTYATGWTDIDGNWYYFSSSTYMFTGWHEIDGEHYFFSETSATIGQMQTGWVQVGSDWFYCNANGIRQYGWQEIDGALYYLDETPV